MEEYKSKDLDHLGIVAVMCEEIGLVQLIDTLIPSDPRSNLTTGECVKLMVINGLGFTSRPLYLESQFYASKPLKRLLGRAIDFEEISDDKLGRTLDRCYEANCNQIFGSIARKAALLFNVDRKFHHLDTTSLQVEIFDAFDRLVSLQKQTSDDVLNTLSHHEIHYDAAGNKREQIEHVYENNLPKRDYLIGWTYDSMGNISTLVEQDEERKITVYTHDNAGRKRTIEKPDGVVLSHTYHPTGLLKTITSSEKSIAYTYRYDANHNPVKMIDDLTGMVTSRRYNAFSEQIEEKQSNGLSTAYQYDPLGRVTKVVLPDGNAIDYVYDAANLVEIHYKDTCRETYKAFDYRGLPWESYLNGDQKTSIHMEWDELGRKVKTDSTFWYEHLDIFDARGNLRQLHYEDSQGSVAETYRYDPLDQLIEEEGASNHTYHYDSIYNRLNKDEQEYIVNDLNQYESDGKAHYTYDPNGNLVEKDDGQTQQRFTYDAFNRLTSVTIPDGIINYQYDADDRRLTKEIVKGEQTTKTAFLYQFDTEIGAVNESNEIFQLRILGNGKGMGSTIAIDLDQALYTVISDHRYNIRCLVDLERKSVAQAYRYSTFGEQQIIGDNNIENFWGFANQRRDQDTNHIHFLKRDYLPDLGRWLTTDPLDSVDGLNLYAYVRNNPFRYTDPDGQFVFTVGIPLVSWGVSIAFPSVATLLTGAAYTAATGLAVWGGYKAGQMLNEQVEPAKTRSPGSRGKPHTPGQEAMSEFVKEFGKGGVSNEDANTLLDWAKEYGFPSRDDRGKDHWEGGEHIHLGPKHIPVC